MLKNINCHLKNIPIERTFILSTNGTYTNIDHIDHRRNLNTSKT